MVPHATQRRFSRAPALHWGAMTPDVRPRRPTWRRRWTIRLVVVAGATAALTLFAAANYVRVELRLVIWVGDVRLSWALLGAAAVGFVLGLVARRPPR